MTQKQDGWKWLVLIASVFSLFLGSSLSYTAGVLHVVLLEQFQEDIVTTTWLGSLFACMVALTGPLASLTINTFNCRVCVMLGGLLNMIGFATSSLITDLKLLFVTYAFITGLGEGLVYTGSVVVLGFYFKDRAALVTGIGVTGSGLGTFVLPPLCKYLLQEYSLRGAFLLLGDISFQTVIFGALMLPSALERKLKGSTSLGQNIIQRVCQTVCGINKFSNFRTLLTMPFLILNLGSFCFCSGTFLNYIFLPAFLGSQGATPQQASFLVSVAGLGGMISRVLVGFAANDSQIGATVMFTGSFGVICIISLFAVPLTLTGTGRVLYALMFGLYTSGGWTLIGPMTLQIVGFQRLATAFGIVMFSCGLGILVGQ